MLKGKLMDIETFNKHGVKVAVRQKDGYVNATMLCKQALREFKAWYRTDTAKSFLVELSRSVNIHTNLLVESVTTGPNEERGTWIHPKVAINLGQWISPHYAVVVTNIVESYHNEGVVINKSKAIQPFDVLKQMMQVFEEQQSDIDELKEGQVETKQNLQALEQKQKELQIDVPIHENQRGYLYQKVHQIASETGYNPQVIWRALKKQFGIASYRNLPRSRFDEAKIWINNYQLNAKTSMGVESEPSVIQDTLYQNEEFLT